MRFTVTALSVAIAASSLHQYEGGGVLAFSTTNPAIPSNRPSVIAFIGDNGRSARSSSLSQLQMGLLGALFGTDDEATEITSKKKKKKPFFATPAKVDDDKPTTSSKKNDDTPKEPDVELPSQQDVRDLFTLWNDALATLDSNLVVQRYTGDAILLPTVSDTPRDSHDSIRQYFDVFLQRKPQGKILESHVTIGDNGSWCQDVGLYEFTLGDDGSKVKARYSFFYVKEGSQWKIAHHHSSQMPEEVVPNLPCMSEKECRQLFYLWNDALATKDPKIVAGRYAKNAVLLPTVSDLPRTSQESIESYFVDFLKREPQGTVLESFVTIGSDWCQDSGIYEFTMKGDQTVRARYSYVYVNEDGEWKIAHHHSSQMPEEIQPLGTAEKDAKANEGIEDTLTEQQVRDLFTLWNDALATEDPKQVAKRYSKRSTILLPTISDEPRMDEASITDYFVTFLKSKPQGVITDGVITCGKGWCKDAGVYEFTMGATGTKVLARYSFVYVLEGGEWVIAHHHSSMMPEPILKKRQELDEDLAKEMKLTHISEKDVAKLFDKWNKALKSKDPKKVAALYHPDALLLPTISNVPRNTPKAIEEYFTTFLKNEPQGVIEDRVILTGKNYAEDAGVYEFTMGASGEQVRARYSFVYTRDETNGEWKISHHHSSAMPEALLDASEKYKMIESVLFQE
ncbi:signal peptide protein [Nitzschia inconspicua]|uniref:Signal peptide protein n=1 Tax=Nitzschia inconspicua TaxID=303405 RepID=A0A9K3KJA2_9STRA|nr:signal peptide protein [Nitzschia inconspicua]